MQNFSTVIFDLYGTLIEDERGMAEREQYRLDTIFTILEKALFPIRFKALQNAYRDMTVWMADRQQENHIACTPFQQVDYILSALSIRDTIVFKRVYEAYSDSVLQISPRLIHNADLALSTLKERGKKIGLISNTGKSPGITLRILLKQLGIYRYFDDVTFSDEAGILKPDHSIFDLAVQKLGADKSDTIFIGDMKTTDYDGAMAAGLKSHLFRREEEDLYQIALAYSGDFE